MPLEDFAPTFWPKVTVVCTCYNQAVYVQGALQSVAAQEYLGEIELIIIDNGSTDSSLKKIETWRAQNLSHLPSTLLAFPDNLGICKAFNQALAIAQGKYIIDLAADDRLLPGKITRQVMHFEQATEDTALLYSNGSFVDERGRVLADLYHRDTSAPFRGQIPYTWARSGDVFLWNLQRHFIAPPTVLFRTQALKAINGYDESLLYEDWDCYIRLLRTGKALFVDEKLMHVTVLTQSHGSKNNPRRAAYLSSTATIIQKAASLCQNEEETQALIKRARYEWRVAMREKHPTPATMIYQWLKTQKNGIDITTRLLSIWYRLKA